MNKFQIGNNIFDVDERDMEFFKQKYPNAKPVTENQDDISAGEFFTDLFTTIPQAGLKAVGGVVNYLEAGERTLRDHMYRDLDDETKVEKFKELEDGGFSLLSKGDDNVFSNAGEYFDQFDVKADKAITEELDITDPSTWGRAGARAVLAGVESWPSIAAAYMGAPAMLALGVSYAGNKFEEELEKNPKASLNQLFVNATGTGAIEAGFEIATRGLFKRAGLIGAGGSVKAAKAVVKGGFMELSKNLTSGFVTEGASEMATELANKWWDSQTIEGREMPSLAQMKYQLGDAFLIGGLVGGTISGVGEISGKSKAAADKATVTLMPLEEKKRFNESTVKLNNLYNDRRKAKTDEAKAIVDKEISKETNIVEKIKNDNFNYLQNLDSKEIKQYSKNIVEINKLNSQIKENSNNATIRDVNSKKIEEINKSNVGMLQKSKVNLADKQFQNIQDIAVQLEKAGGKKINVIKGNTKDFQEFSKQRGVEQDFDYDRRYGGMLPILDDGGNVTSLDIFINEETVLRDGKVNTSAHEFLHAAVFATLKQNIEAGEVLGGAVLKALGANKATLREGSDFNERINSYSKEEGGGEEILTITGEAISNNEINLNEGFVGGLKDAFRRFGQKHLNFDMKFDTDQDILNFVKDYSRAIKDPSKLNKALIKVAALGAEGKLAPDKVKADPKLAVSKEASEKVQSIYEKEGATGAFDIISEFKPIVNKIVEKRSQAPNFDRELLTSEIEIGKRGILDLISEYKPESGVPLAAFINKFLPSRAIEASRRVLGEEFTEDVSERVDIAADEVAEVDVQAKPKKKKIVLADRLRVENKVDTAVKKIFPSLNLKKLDFKSLKDLTPEITGEMFGISPKKLLNNANITKVELQAAQMFINKNADLLIAMLPEGATVSGTSTGVQKVLLDAFYTKSNRARAAKTGSKAGLAVQVKNPNITKVEFLETFGIINGKPVRTDRNTSSRVLALAKQTGKMMSNQAVRKILLSDKNSPAHVLGVLEDGKPKMMWSQQSSLNAEQIKKQGASERNLEQRAIGEEFLESQKDWNQSVKDAGEKPLDMISDNGVSDYLQLLYYGLGPKLPESFFRHNGTYTGTSKPIKDKDGNTIKRTRTRNYPFINVKQVQQSVDSVKQDGDFGDFADPDVDIENAMQRDSYETLLKMDPKKRQELLESKARGFKKIWQAFDELIESDPQLGIPLVGALMSSVSATQLHFGRTASIFSFYNTLNEANVEEHAGPASDMNKFLFNRAIDGNLFGELNYFDGAVQSFIQGDLPARFDTPVLKGEGYNYVKNAPPEYAYDILLGLKPIWIRYWNANVNNNGRDFDKGKVGGIDPNVIVLLNDKTIAQEFGVDVDPDLLTPHVIMMQQDLLADIFLGKTTSADAKIAITNFANVKIKQQVGPLKIKEKAIKQGRMMASKKPKGITVLDFDDTLATSKSLIRYTKPDGEEGTLTPEQYASTYEDLLDKGYEFDFSEFNKVVDGRIAPLFQKALKLQGKFGSENMFVLTARPAQSQKAIFEFLKANGLNIPLKNITGLGNSTAEAKALWMAEKVGEGYNDFYFADDALQNVQAVDNVLEQFDVKRKVQQAKIQFSKDLDKNFNDILENVTGIESKKQFAATKARKRGADKGKFRIFIPPSHEDFVGLLYNFMGKGTEGNKHRDFLEQALVRPLNRAYKEIDTAKQAVANDYKELNKQMADVNKKLTQKTPDGDFTYQDAIRVYLWDKHGYKIPGLSDVDQVDLVDIVGKDPSLQAYAEALNIISKQEKYVDPGQNWETGNIRIDLVDATGRVGRVSYFAEFQESADVIFSETNLNKIEAAYGPNFRSALEDMLHRVKTGINRPKGASAQPNMFMNWLNASVAGVMFFNTRSALLQQMSNVNYLNFADNNIFTAGLAFANQPQYWKDFAMIFNSDMLKQRRGGLQTDINGAELAEAIKKARPNNMFDQVAIITGKALRLGFLPTQIGDNIAIATGGAAFYRNRVNKYIKDGLSQKEAETKAFTDFQNITQSTQQSARPDMTSQQQASWIGKLVLNFLNTPSQYNRIIKKAGSDILNKRITPPNTSLTQSNMSNASRMLYYGAAQNLIFYSLQTALFAVMFGGDDEDEDKRVEAYLTKKQRVIQGSIDTILRGSGIYGVAVSTLKNMAIKFMEQREKGYNKDESAVVMEMLNFSPVVGIKARRIVNAEKTLNYNKKVIKEMETFDIDNPAWSAVTNYTQTITTAPVNKIYQKTINLRNAADNDYTAMQRLLFLSGYTTWALNLGETKKMEEVKEEIKRKKEVEKKKEKEKKKQNKKTTSRIIRRKVSKRTPKRR